MIKYIDADLLRKEINRRIELLTKAILDWSKQGDKETSVYYSGKSVALDEFAKFIDSLQQEQPEVDLEKEIEQCWQSWLSPSNQLSVEGVLPKSEFSMYARHFCEFGFRRAAEMYDEIEYNRQRAEEESK